MKRRIIKINLSILVSTVLVLACTNLEVEPTDSVFNEADTGGFGGVNAQSNLNNLYNDVYGQLGDQANFFALNEVSTDEMLVPTRGTDWGDNGIWRTLHTHTWDPQHLYILNVWNNLNQNVYRASEIIDSRSSPSAQQKAEAQFLRAFSMFFVLDLYGQVPFRGLDDGPNINPAVMTKQEAYDFIVSDLTEAIPNLPPIAAGAEGLSKASQAAGRFLLAKVMMNGERYTGTAADYDAVIDLIDAIAAEGYALEDGYFEMFTEEADTETIWWASTSVGNRIWNGMHYHIVAPDNTGGGWNGFSTLAEFYDLFEGDPNSNYVGDGQEERRGWVPDASNADDVNLGIGYGFLIGQMYDANGVALKDRPGNPLAFTKEIPGLAGNNERTGIRTIKYHPAGGRSFNSHEIVFRYADAHLLKAEAILRGGGDPTALVNELRTIRQATPLGSVTAQDLIDERGRELYKEFWRRNDLVRFGQYTKDWEFKDAGSVGDDTKNYFPIPTNALLSNPNLVQNPGY
ncbi:RagB/SusD family nutrient uptake outer membrane protein [Flagellimonas olearia]|uniref:RagB/SusD family nutrient uptake outer membrane protein n=1 Tax=Flagellimonas olearia TaxID=552546 RepID=A0A6I1DY87_9FLAO|nr:RagB/SusD family nutrient uptake outer membrane protein [Allomuricauda olearia]KAB7528293.1 RagB/SusD family nutrient uptake outer membrane protein [Allomuricauda olearia]